MLGEEQGVALVKFFEAGPRAAERPEDWHVKRIC